jgi:hypothetical protein
MKMNRALIKCLATLLLFSLNNRSLADVTTEIVRNGDTVGPSGGMYYRNGTTKQLVLPAGKTLTILGVNRTPYADPGNRGSTPFINAVVEGSTNKLSIWYGSSSSLGSLVWNGPIRGPLTIEYGLLQSLSSSMTPFPVTEAVFIFDIQETSSSQATSASISSASVVVPSNAVGDVDVLLEQSNDMITWTQCLPGTYNASTQKRFFRVRAVEK